MQNKAVICFSLIFFIFILAGCSSTSKVYIKSDNIWNPPRIVAVLPFANMSKDEQGPVMVRLLFIQKLNDKGYIVQDPNETDKILQDLGITYGGQLNSITPEELDQQLGVDGLFYGTVLNFEYTVGIIETKKEVRLDAKFIDGWRNVLYWESSQGFVESKSRVFTILGSRPEDMLKNVAADIGKDLVTKAIVKSLKDMIGHPLYIHSEQCISLTLSSLPDYMPGYIPLSNANNINNTNQVESTN